MKFNTMIKARYPLVIWYEELVRNNADFSHSGGNCYRGMNNHNTLSFARSDTAPHNTDPDPCYNNHHHQYDTSSDTWAKRRRIIFHDDRAKRR